MMAGRPGKATLCVPLGKINEAFRFIARTPRIRVGLFLLVINVPFGYGGAALGAFLAGALKNSLWLKCGTAAYVLSWIMLFAATILLGKETKSFATKTIARKWRAWRKMRKMGNRTGG